MNTTAYNFLVHCAIVSSMEPGEPAWSGTITVIADTEELAQLKTLKTLEARIEYDERIDPSCQIYSVERSEIVDGYIIAEGWQHIFGNGETRTVRWVWDRVVERLYLTEILYGNGWKEASLDEERDIVADVLANDAPERWEEHGCFSSQELPSWASSTKEDSPFRVYLESVLGQEQFEYDNLDDALQGIKRLAQSALEQYSKDNIDRAISLKIGDDSPDSDILEIGDDFSSSGIER